MELGPAFLAPPWGSRCGFPWADSPSIGSGSMPGTWQVLSESPWGGQAGSGSRLHHL